MPRPVRDLTKEGKFGRLKPIAMVGRKYGKNMYFLCLCDCGAVVEVRGSHLASGNREAKSCGCWMREHCAQVAHEHNHLHRTHGASGTPTFRSWAGMIKRCMDERHPSYHDYGGRGIKVHDRWLDFANFLADMGERPENTTLDRHPDMNGDYEPGNCRWATNREQHTNMRSNVRLTFDGRTQTLVEWAEEKGMSPKTLWSRLNVCGWPVEQALTEPVMERFGR